MGLPAATLRKACAPGRGRRRSAAGSAHQRGPREEIQQLKREVAELRKANEILRAELDRGRTRRARPSTDIVIASASSSSAAPWGCRRRPTHQRASGEHSKRSVEDERRLARIRWIFALNYECCEIRAMHTALVRDGEQVGRDRSAHGARLGEVRAAGA
jgi:hypothetical protein